MSVYTVHSKLPEEEEEEEDNVPSLINKGFIKL